MNITELYNMSYLAASSGVDYSRLRSNLMARPDKVKLTPDERADVIRATEKGVEEMANG